MLPCAGGENIGFDFSGDQKILSTLLYHATLRREILLAGDTF